MGEAGGRRRSLLPAPPPRPAPASRADQVPAPAARPPLLALAAPPACQGWAWGAGTRAAAAGTGRVPGARPESPPSTRLARAQGTATDAAPAPSPHDAPLRPDVGGCGGRAAARGRRRGGKRFLPFPGAQGSFCGRFYLRSQTKFAAAFPRAAPPKVKRSDWRPAGAQPVGQEPRGEHQSRDPGRGGGRQIPPSWGTSPAAPYPQSTAPEVAAAPSGAVSEKALAHRGRGAGTEHPCQNRQGHVPLQRCTTRGFLKAERRPHVLPAYLLREPSQGACLTKMLPYGNPKDNGRREQTSEARMLAGLCSRPRPVHPPACLWPPFT
ncbi:translation initiation factor IF-2-like isoform X1 [Phocoena sinus]|uniref:translation initiation factor IF-2-like isoform X1 n=1 Tax=Phocoena sinus TaxID=42100 RepID=UPI0013C4ECBF|nr:translation initiation factor IF-2-like isoform X1 [Phocoena sinus]